MEKQTKDHTNHDNKDYQAVDTEEPNLDDALEGFDDNGNNNLNISAQGADDDIFDPKVQEQYEKLMKQMGSEGGLTGMMENLMSSIGQKAGESSQPNSKEQQQFKSKMNDLLKGLEGGNLQDVANKLLNQFMDKEILQQPLQQTKKAYQQIFANPGKVKASEDDLDRYRKQYFVVKDILSQLQKDPNDKDALIKKFEEMQKYGSPPEGINVSM